MLSRSVHKLKLKKQGLGPTSSAFHLLTKAGRRFVLWKLNIHRRISEKVSKWTLSRDSAVVKAGKIFFPSRQKREKRPRLPTVSCRGERISE